MIPTKIPCLRTEVFYEHSLRTVCWIKFFSSRQTSALDSLRFTDEQTDWVNMGSSIKSPVWFVRTWFGDWPCALPCLCTWPWGPKPKGYLG